MFYNLRVNQKVLSVASQYVDNRGHFADAYGRACGLTRAERNALLGRLKRSGLSTTEAAAVKCLWLAHNAMQDRKSYPIKEVLEDVYNSICASLEGSTMEKLDGLGRIQQALEAEKIKEPV